jgi:hypothetical protein
MIEALGVVGKLIRMGSTNRQARDDAKALGVAFETTFGAGQRVAAVFLVDQAIENLFAVMAKRRMAQVVSKCSSFDDVGIKVFGVEPQLVERRLLEVCGDVLR